MLSALRGSVWVDIGSVAPGRYADFFIVDGDPLRDTRELRKLTTVY
jgi:imidazolonepropionase-like amidohydrolase